MGVASGLVSAAFVACDADDGEFSVAIVTVEPDLRSPDKADLSKSGPTSMAGGVWTALAGPLLVVVDPTGRKLAVPLNAAAIAAAAGLTED